MRKPPTSSAGCQRLAASLGNTNSSVQGLEKNTWLLASCFSLLVAQLLQKQFLPRPPLAVAMQGCAAALGATVRDALLSAGAHWRVQLLPQSLSDVIAPG